MRAHLHDLTNRLSVILSYSELAQTVRGKDDSEVIEKLRRYLTKVGDAAQTAHEIIVHMRARTADSGVCDLNAILIDEAASVGLFCDVVTDLEPNLPLAAMDGLDVRRIVINLMTNARESMAAGKSIQLVSRRRPPQMVEFAVVDGGSGMTDSMREQLLHCKSVSTKGNGRGTGLSRVVWPMLVRVGGKMEIMTSGQGTTFTIAIPAVEQ